MDEQIGKCRECATQDCVDHGLGHGLANARGGNLPGGTAIEGQKAEHEDEAAQGGKLYGEKYTC
jgi:hypothetical protein